MAYVPTMQLKKLATMHTHPHTSSNSDQLPIADFYDVVPGNALCVRLVGVPDQGAKPTPGRLHVAPPHRNIRGQVALHFAQDELDVILVGSRQVGHRNGGVRGASYSLT